MKLSLFNSRKLNIILLLSFILILMFSFSVSAAPSWMDVVDDIGEKIDLALEQYEDGKVKIARESVTNAYFGPFEGEEMEQAIQRNIGSQVAFKVEYAFTQIKELMKNGASQSEVEKRADKLIQDLKQYANELDELAPRENNSPLSKFIYSLLIIVREGFEAILVLSAIIAYLIKSGNQDKLKTVYSSTAVAILASILTAVAFKYLFNVSAFSQEILEGVTMLLAMVVLFSVSFWMLSKIETKKWENYIQGKVENSISTGRSLTLALAVFLAVYREGAETVLFYQALIIDTAKSNYGMIGLGFLVGSMLLALIYIVIRKGSDKLPLKPFFAITSILMYYLTVVFAGKGIRELQEAGVVGTSIIEGWPTVNLIGLYPTWQTISLQVILIIAAVAGGLYYFVGSKKKEA